MPTITKLPVPQSALLAAYCCDGCYTDCYTTSLSGKISHATYVQAFYTSWLFKIERKILAWILRKPSTDAEAAALADGSVDRFAAWTVEARDTDQVLLCDLHGRTRSWLMTDSTAISLDQKVSTRFYFGSAVVPITAVKTGKQKMGWVFRSLLGFHRLYSRALLKVAVRKLS